MAEDLGVLRVSLGLDNTQFTGSVKQINARLNALNAEFRATSSGVEGFEQSLEGMRAKSQNLTQVLELQRDKARRLREEYQQVAATYGENSAQAQRLSARYNSVIAVINRTQTQLSQLNSEIALQENRWHQLSQRLNETSNDLREFGENARNAGSQMSVGLTAPIVAAGVAVGMIASQFEDAQVKIQNSLGVSSEEAEKFADIAQNIWVDGFGEDLNTVSDALIKVKQNIKGISDEAELEKVTRDTIILAETFDSDVNEVTRAGQGLMKNFGISSDDAFNLMATGAQKGLNFSQEMFDNLSEYSGLFAKMGFSAEEYFQLLVNGSKAGVYNLDYINDVMKEFQIRVKDGSKTTSDAMGQMSESTQKVWKEFLKGNGTVKDVSNVVLTELKSMDDQVAANNIGVSLFGTKWEDLEAEAMYSLTTVGNEMSNVTGAMDKMAKAQEQTFSQRWQSLLREAQQQLEPIGQKVLEIAEDFLPKLSDGLDMVVGWFTDLDDEGQNLVFTLVGLAAAAGPLLIGGGLIASGAGSVVSLASSFASAAAKGGLLTAAIGAISGPAGWAVLGTTAVVGLGAAIVNLSKDSETVTEEMLRLQEETFNTAMASYDAAQKNVELANSYDQLRDKSSLTVDELLRYKDIQSQLESTTSADKVALLKDELTKLQEKSGLTADELANLISLDQQIIEQVPGVESAYDAKGNAVVKYSDAVKEVANAQLELQKAEAMATLTETIGGLGEQVSKLNELRESYVSLSETKTSLEQQQIGIETELVKIEQNRLVAKSKGLEFDEQTVDVHSRQMEISREKKEIEDQMKNATGAHLEILKQQERTLENERKILNGSNGELMTREEYLEESLRLLKQELTANGENLTATSKEKALIEEKLALSKLQYTQILDYLAKEVGITAEEGKQLEAMESQYAKNAEIINQLQKQKGTAEGLTKEEQARLDELINHNKQIGKNIDEAELLNSTLSEDIVKELGIDDKGKVDKINKELTKQGNKIVIISDKGEVSNINKELGKTISKTVRVFTQNGDVITSGGRIPQYAKGTNYHPGGLAIVGEKGPELVNLPTGSKVFTNQKTKEMLSIQGNLSLSGTDLRQIGSDTMAGLDLGIQSGSGSVMNSVLGVGAGIEDTLRKRLDIHSPSRVTKEIGYWISAGLSEGIDSGKPLIAGSVKELDKLIISESKKTGNEILKLQKEYAKADKNERVKIKQDILKLEQDMSANQLTVIENFVSEKKKLNEISLMDEVAIWRESVKFFAENNNYAQQKEAHEKYRDSLAAINSEIISINQNYSSKVLEVNEELKKREEELTQSYTKAVDDRAKSLMSFTGLFEEFDVKFEISGQKLLSNLQSQVEGFKMWQKEIEELATRAIDEGLLEQLRSMGPDALAEVLALNDMTDEQLSKYSDLYKEKSKLAKNQAVSELEGLRLKNEATMKQLNIDATKELSILETEWKKSIKGITTSTKTGLDSLYSVGVNASKGLLDGLSSMEGELKAKAKSMANSITREIQSALKIKSPSRVTRGFGVNIGQGLILGMDDMEDGVAKSSLRLADSVVNSLNLDQPTIFGEIGGSLLNKSNNIIRQTTSSSYTTDNSKYMQPSITIVNQAPNNSPSDIARKALQTQRQLAMEWGVV